ncbi:protein translocase subunit SecD [Streptomyces sp. NPDC050504]|uniref:protein translocase subunit SecD n=1 Tax=Streptomyces sp. NPDC050504 TaxID=3365618 RepID=UPI003789542F
MAAPKKGRRPTGTQGRPGRTLALILIAMVALTGGMFWSGHTTPRLGIDLAGGTSITLKAKPDPGAPTPKKSDMDTAVSIMERRVNGLGVQEAEVQTQGDDNIIVNVPKGTNSEQAQKQVGTTAKLYFRPVLLAAGPEAQTKQPPATKPSGKPSGSPSGKASDKPSDKASDADKADKGDKAKDEKATPSGTATSQGRAVTDGLKKDATPSPSATSKDTPKPSKTPEPTPSGGAGDMAALQAKFAATDCTTPAGRANAAAGTKPDDTIVACGNKGDQKFILGPQEVEGKDIDGARGEFDQQRGQWRVTMDFTGSGSKKFQKITSKLSQKQDPENRFAIVLDGQVVSAPSVSQTLSGSAEITGQFKQQEAQDLGNILSFGALPLTFETQSVDTVSAALGGDQLRAGLIAGAIGLALVIFYLVAYYRGLALIAIASLGVSAVLTYTIMALLGPSIGFALNLPAVCGAIVAIGITADSFIVYFERVRDEVREGRTLRPAVERAWPRARRTVLVSDFVSFLAAAVLFVVTVGKVQGFAFTLGLTTLLDVVVVFFFTKPVMTLAARTKFFADGHKWSGLDPKRLGAKPPLRRTRRPATASTDPKEA